MVKPLERMLEEINWWMKEEIDWKDWIPLYGQYNLLRDIHDDKLDYWFSFRSEASYVVSCTLYHSFIFAGSLAYLINSFGKKL